MQEHIDSRHIDRKHIDSEHIRTISRALAGSDTVVIGADCEVSYSGRAESFLPRGERVIMIKSDKTLLVHQPTGSNPVNYMKEGSLHSIVIKDGKAWLRSQNTAQKEYLDILLHSIHFSHSHPLQDAQSIVLKGSEKDMAELIMQNPELIEPGFRPCSREEHTQYGFIDVFGNDGNGNLVIVECKRYHADLSAVTQLRRYVERIAKSKGVPTGNVRGIIAAPGISSNAEQMLRDWGFEFKQLTAPHYFERYNTGQKRLEEF